MTPAVFKIPRPLVEGMFAHARERAPEECCGLLGGVGESARTAYGLRNVSARPEVAYEAEPVELFDVQLRMRARGEEIVAVYHSHPLSADPAPSPADVRLAFHPSAVYLIIGFDAAGACVLRAFRISEREGRWESAAFEVED